MNVNDINTKIESFADPEKALNLQRFFKTGKGEYGEGDIFLGISVPYQRKIAKEFRDIGLDDIKKLIDNKVHEKRLIALLILIEKFRKSDDFGKKEIFDFYLLSAKNNLVNNWDLVDLSAHQIVGGYLSDKNRKIIYDLVSSENLWERRIAIISTFTFIRCGEFDDSLKISKVLLNDKQDLIQKAVGWMLREVGKKNVNILEEFLKLHYQKMPRTMLRYAIEKFDAEKRKMYLAGDI